MSSGPRALSLSTTQDIASGSREVFPIIQSRSWVGTQPNFNLSITPVNGTEGKRYVIRMCPLGRFTGEACADQICSLSFPTLVYICEYIGNDTIAGLPVYSGRFNGDATGIEKPDALQANDYDLYFQANRDAQLSNEHTASLPPNTAPVVDFDSRTFPTSFQLSMFVYDRRDPHIDSGKEVYHCPIGSETDRKRCQLALVGVSSGCIWRFVK